MLRHEPRKDVGDKLVYIPFGAEKGDCPYCLTGVLRRDDKVQDSFSCREGYICAKCGVVFLETMHRRYFDKVTSWGRPNVFNVY